MAGKIFHPSKKSGRQLAQGAQKNCKIVVIQTLEKYGAQKSQGSNHVQANKTRHKKGKSMDLEQLMTHERDIIRQYNQTDASKQKARNSKDIPVQFKDRKSISEMKQYVNVSKKLGTKRDEIRRKKEKTNHSHDLKYMRKQMKKIIEETPIFPKQKKKDGQKSTKSHQMNLNSKNLKSYSKSE